LRSKAGGALALVNCKELRGVKVGKMTEVVAGLIGEALSAEVHDPESATVLSVKEEQPERSFCVYSR
jgi:hypothetical protein